MFHGSGAGLYGRWLRRVDIHDGFLSAALARSRQVVGGGIRVDLEDFPFSAHWANHPSVLYDQFTMVAVRFQDLFLRFFKTCLLFH